MIKRLNIIALCIFLSVAVFAQNSQQAQLKDMMETYNAAIDAKNERNYEQAMKTFLTGYEKGDHLFCPYGIAELYLNGQGVPANAKKAIDWFLISAKNGFRDAQAKLGDLYYYGVGTEKNLEASLKWYMEAANNGDVYSMYCVGLAFHGGFGTPVNYEKAIFFYEKAAQKGHPDAANNLSVLLLNGEGCKQDVSKGIIWKIKAAEGGNSDAQYILGFWYEKGSYGIQMNKEKSIEWYSKAASQGHPQAAIKLQELRNK